MFENVIDQPSVAVLTADLRAGRLPPSVLFSGPAYSGKLTAALELARVLSCEAGSGGWSCTCPSCLRHKELASPDTLILGARSCMQEIRAAAASLLSADPPSPAHRYLFLRAVRKLTLRFHPVFADSPERAAKPASVLASLNEYLEELSPAYPAPDSDRLAKLTEAAVDASVRLEENFLYSSVPVGFVRSVSSWLRIKPAGKVKVLIVENTETMQDAARNAFLKILEEPPESVQFVLTTVQKSAVMPTILSRVRNYSFSARSAASQEEVIRRIFRAAPAPGQTIAGFLNQFLPVKPDSIAICARRFLFSVLCAAGRGKRLSAMQAMGGVLSAYEPAAREKISPPEIAAALNKGKPLPVWRLFLSSVAGEIRLAMRQPALSPEETEVFRRWMQALKTAFTGTTVFNLSPAASLERLDAEFRAAIQG